MRYQTREVEHLIYKNVVALCKKHNISVSKLEKEVGLGNGTIGKWEKVSPTVERVEKVANYFGVSIDALNSEAPTE